MCCSREPGIDFVARGGTEEGRLVVDKTGRGGFGGET